MEVKISEFENEVWIRKCAFCKTDEEVCNVCKYVPKDMLKHKHKFFYIKILVKTNWWRRLFNKELKTQMYECPCGKLRMIGYQIPLKKLPDDWKWSYA